MNVPNFIKYGVLGCMTSQRKDDRFHYVHCLGDKDLDSFRSSVRKALTDMYNDKLTTVVTDARNRRLRTIEGYVGTVKVHPLTDFGSLNSKYTSLDAVTEVVFEESAAIMLPTVRTSLLIKEMLRRPLIRVRNASIYIALAVKNLTRRANET